MSAGQGKRQVNTWLTYADYDRLVAMAKAANVSPTALVRGMIIDVLNDDEAAHSSGAAPPPREKKS